MELIVDHRPIALSNGYQSPEDVLLATERVRPPLVVIPQTPQSGDSFLVQRRVYLSGVCSSGRRVQLENDHELWFACKLVSDDHNHWQQFSPEKTLDCLEETELMEEAARKHMEEAADVGEEGDNELVLDAGWRD